MQKFFVEKQQIKEDKITIIGTDVNHIKNVLRYQAGDKIQIGDKESKDTYIAIIEKCNSEEIQCKMIEKKERNKKKEIQIDLYQGLPKADKMEWIIQKTTELGIASIIPVAMERSIVKIQEKEVSKKIDRWQKIAEVAAKQSKREEIPKIHTIMNLQQVLEKIKEYDLFITAYEEEKEKTLKQVLRELKVENEIKIGILIGPEGGISLREIEKLKEKQTQIITLGDRILRTETAPIAITSMIMYELE